MEVKGHNILTLNIESLLNGDDHYVIPVYQRNYAWQEAEITQMIQDVFDYIPEGQDYYIGTLVTDERKFGSELFYETIDGQQRVTTLTLLTCAIRHFYPEVALPWFKKINLEFASRTSSSETLQHIYLYGQNFSPDYDWNERIVDGFELCKEMLRKKLTENKENNIDVQTFSSFLFSKVKILRVTVPQDTDLNHYFEIMNNRGEQLEKHEILKSKFLEILNGLEESEREHALGVFNKVWEACSNMEKYIQYGFSVDERNDVFGQDDWNTLQPNDFFDLSQKLKSNLTKESSSKEILLSEIIEGKVLKPSETNTEDVPERFNSVINFQNFLLHVLRIYTRTDIPLDDKRLIPIFEAHIKAADDKIRFAQEFGFELLRCKFFFDKYIIKREFIGGNDRWSMKRLKWYKENKVSYVNTFGEADDESNDENRTILMLLSMFHVSTPTLVYKHWLNAALLYVMEQNDFVDSRAYKNYLVAIARSFVFDRFLCKGEPKEYFDIIYHSTATVTRNSNMLELNKLSFGLIENNLVFNYLDYLLWDHYKSKDKRINQFEYSFRSSVEHYYPRHPMPGYKQLNEVALDSFGNLCLISHSKNSRLSNQPPIAKRSHYNKQNLDSVKQWIMMEEYNADDWDEESIADHQQKMIQLITTQMNSDFGKVTPLNQAIVTDKKAWRWFNQYKNDTQNRSLLARAILCFGEIAVETGSSSYLDEWHPKFFLYDWDVIKASEAFTLFCNYVERENPSGLSSIIQYNLEKNKQLQNDPYRFVFVKHPEIWEYCQQGYFTWINEGETVLLHNRERNTENTTIHLSILLLSNWFKKTFLDDIYEWREGFSVNVDYNQGDGIFIFEGEDGKGEMIVEWEENGKIKCHIKPHRNASNSTFVQRLQELDWQIDFDSYYKRGASSTLISLNKNYEEDFIRATEKLDSIIKNGLRIKLP